MQWAAEIHVPPRAVAGMSWPAVGFPPGSQLRMIKGGSGRARGRTQPGWAAEPHQGAGKLKLHQRETAKGIFDTSCQLRPHIKMWCGRQVHEAEPSHPAQGQAKMSLFIVTFQPQDSYGSLTSTRLHYKIHSLKSRLESFKSVFSHTPLLKSQTQATRGRKSHPNTHHRASKVAAGMMLDSKYPFPVYNLPNIFTIVFSCFLKLSSFIPVLVQIPHAITEAD